VTRSSAWLGLLAGAVAAFVIACGAAVPTSAPTHYSSKPGVTAVERRPDDVRAEIDQLDHDIGTREDGAQLAAPTDAEVSAAAPVPMVQIENACTPPEHPSDTCADACKLGDAICVDATRICQLAEQLPGDSWAQGKCAGGKASCERARQRCCDCK
jgi:hypothetical protein